MTEKTMQATEALAFLQSHADQFQLSPEQIAVLEKESKSEKAAAQKALRAERREKAMEIVENKTNLSTPEKRVEFYDRIVSLAADVVSTTKPNKKSRHNQIGFYMENGRYVQVLVKAIG